MTIDPGLRGNLIAPLTITITPSADIDLGNGPGVAKVVTVNPGDPLTFELCVTAPNDGKGEGDEIGTINFGVASNDPAYDGLPIAPLVLEIIDALPSRDAGGGPVARGLDRPGRLRRRRHHPGLRPQGQRGRARLWRRRCRRDRQGRQQEGRAGLPR